MSEQNVPGSSPQDIELVRRWRGQFDELPSEGVDLRIRAAARAADEVAQRVQSRPDASSRTQRWFRIAPLAAAASVALLAVGLVRLIPREEYAAIPPSPPPAAPRAETPAAGAESADAEAQSPMQVPMAAESSADEEARRAPVFVPDAPTGAGVPEENVTRSLDVPARNSAAAPAAAAPPDQSPPAQELSRAAPAPGNLGGSGALARAPTTEMTTQAASDATVDKAAEAATRPTAAALADAARRTGMTVDQLRVVEVTPVTWRDASLDCGETDAGESEDTGVPGFVIAVEARGTVLRYHTDADDQVRVCE